MIQKHKFPRIFFPRNVNEALDIAAREPKAIYWGGGCIINPGQKVFPSVVISLAGIEDLSRASRTEQFLELGAMIRLDRLVSISKKVFPPGITNALTQITTWPIRCRTTLGGQLARQDILGELRLFMHALDARIEIRFPKTSRYRTRLQRLSVTGLSKDHFKEKGLITQISIPLKSWTSGQLIKIMQTAAGNDLLIFCALARIEKNIFTDFRIAFADNEKELPRDKELESSIEGRSFPLSNKEIHSLKTAVNRLTRSWKDRKSERETAEELAIRFLKRADIIGHL